MEAAGAIAASQGLEALTLEGVARRAGVSKGGLLHHFPSRRALVEGLCADLYARWDEEIARYMQADPVAEGRFTRAYVRTVTAGSYSPFDIRLVGALVMTMNTDEGLREQWALWLAGYLARDGEGTVARRMARAAADGLWLAGYTGAPAFAPDELEEMIGELLRTTL